MYQAKVNNKTFTITQEGDENSFTVNDQTVDLDLVSLKDGSYHVIQDNQSYNIEIVFVDKVKKEVSVKVNNRIYSVNVKDQLDLLLSKLDLKKC